MKQFTIAVGVESTTAIAYPTTNARAIMILAHGAGAAQTHPFMVAFGRGLAWSADLAACIAETGQRTLLVDMDPQGGCAVCLGMDTNVLTRSIYDALVRPDMSVADVLFPTKFNFDLAPATIDLAGAEIELKQALAALAYLLSLKINHCDLKPKNVLVKNTKTL